MIPLNRCQGSPTPRVRNKKASLAIVNASMQEPRLSLYTLHGDQSENAHTYIVTSSTHSEIFNGFTMWFIGKAVFSKGATRNDKSTDDCRHTSEPKQTHANGV
jgi:hypothetical protein